MLPGVFCCKKVCRFPLCFLATLPKTALFLHFDGLVVPIPSISLYIPNLLCYYNKVRRVCLCFRHRHQEREDIPMGLLDDARNIQRKDPAARSVLEVILLYPGFHILVYHRIAHWLYQHKRFFLARWVSQHGRRRTGIEIHPGATIGKCLFIDHGMGIVFGETTEIGDNCTIYHGVTLGGTGKDAGKRHPTLGNNVLIGAGTKVLGPVYIGDNSRIGAGSVVLRNLPANCTAVGVPAEVVRINNKAVNPADDLDQQDLPDLVAQRLTDLDRRLGVLENAAQGDTPPTAEQIAARQKP
jgi:serine O-acetyltransferase